MVAIARRVREALREPDTLPLHVQQDIADRAENVARLATDEWLIRQRRRRLRDMLGLMFAAATVLLIWILGLGE